MDKQHFLYCFHCKQYLEFESWFLHSTHHSKLFLFPQEMTIFYKFVEPLFDKPKKKAFKMIMEDPETKSSKYYAISSNYITPEESGARQELCGILYDGITPIISKFYDFYFDVEVSSLISVTEFYDTKFEDEISKYSESETLTVFISICEGVLALHNEGFFHGNICPANIVFAGTKLPRILGVVNAQKIGSPNYEIIYEYSAKSVWTPEFLLGKMLNEKFDIWGLGILLHRMLSGDRLPFLEYRNERKMHQLIRACCYDESKREKFIAIDKGVGKVGSYLVKLLKSKRAKNINS